MKTGKINATLTLIQRGLLCNAAVNFQLTLLRRANKAAATDTALSASLRDEAKALHEAEMLLSDAKELERMFGSNGVVEVDGRWRIALRGDVTPEMFATKVAAIAAYYKTLANDAKVPS